MSNKVYDNTLYNSEVKEQFLQGYVDNTARIYRRVLERSSLIENIFQKDLFNFNLDELKQVLGSLNPLTHAAAEANGRYITAYIHWAMDNGYTNSNINPLKTIDNEWFHQFVTVDTKDLLFTYNQLLDIEDFCVNYQDKVIFRLLFEGVQGSGASELANLTEKDVDFDNHILHLKDNEKGERNVKVSDTAIGYIDRAIREKEYLKRNGMADLKANQKATLDLIDNKYVIRNTLTRTIEVDKVDKHTIYRRIALIKDLYGDMAYLTVKNIVRSGKLYEAYKLYKEYGVLEKEQYMMIAEKFNISKVQNGNRYDYNWTSLKREGITIDNIKLIYSE